MDEDVMLRRRKMKMEKRERRETWERGGQESESGQRGKERGVCATAGVEGAIDVEQQGTYLASPKEGRREKKRQKK